MAEPQQPIVLITGAAGNLGQAVARAFRREGAALALLDQDVGRLRALAESVGPPCVAEIADVTDGDAAVALCRRVAAEFGRIDVLVNVAGTFRSGPVHETSDETWDLLMDLNARSVLNMARGAVPVMLRQGRGRIINVAARPALRGDAGIGAYAASKAAVLRLTESMSAELADRGITVNAVLPSVIDTPQNRKAMPPPDGRFDRWVAPESLAAVILFLASDAARDVSGAALPVYGRS